MHRREIVLFHLVILKKISFSMADQSGMCMIVFYHVETPAKSTGILIDAPSPFLVVILS